MARGTPRFVLLTSALVFELAACAKSPGRAALVAQAPAQGPSPSSHAAPNASSSVHALSDSENAFDRVSSDTRLTFHRVAEFTYPVRFAPLGSDALLITGEWTREVPLLIERNQLTFRAALTHFDSTTKPGFRVTVTGGTWPDNAWLALSYTSDAGPCYADIYRWNAEPSHARWEKQFEHSACVAELPIWSGSPVLLGAFFSVPVQTSRPIDALMGPNLHNLVRDSCPLNASDGAPASSWVHGGALTVFGYACPTPEAASSSLLVDTWDSGGSKTERSLPPGDAVERVLVDKDGPLFLFPKQEQEPRHLARFIAGRWATLATLPPDFVMVDAPNALELWGVSGGELLSWNDGKWLSWVLPSAEPGTELSATSVWRRSAHDVWLIAQQKSGETDGKVRLFNSADGALGSEPFPTDPERERLVQAMTQDPPDCPHPFANFVVRLPHQLGADVALPYLSDAAVRRRLRHVLSQRPQFRHLHFLEHDCYGEDCVGAQVANAAEAEAFRALLPRDGYAGDNRCSLPPVTSPFAI